jgi:hypothetical protein
MDRVNILRSSTRTPSILVSSGLHPVTATSGLNTRTEELITTVVAASATRVSLDRTAPSQLFSSRSRRSHWVRIRDALSLKGVAATRGPPAKIEAVVADVDDLTATAPAPAEPTPAAPAPEAPAPVAPAAAPPKQTTEATRVELTIDSLRNYELIKPIPVFVESLGDRHYVAEVPDANISTSASNLSEILIILKDSVTQTYDKLRIRKDLDKEQAKQLKVLETYIGRSRRSWLDRR